MTWHDLAPIFPEFVQWIVQTYGPLPEGEVKKEDYDRYMRAWEEAIIERRESWPGQ